MRCDRVLSGMALVLSVFLLFPRTARAVPAYAARTGFTCISCHFDPNGGGPRKELGFLFARQRHSTLPDTSQKWSGLNELSNRLGDWFYFGTNTRMYYLYDHAKPYGTTPSSTISTFFQMQSAIYLSARPHDHLFLTWALDYNELTGSQTRDAYGMIDGLPKGLYFQIGQFRNPFGLRLDDHTAGTRYGFLNPPLDAGGALPYDPRQPQAGVEVGAAPGEFFGALAVQNGQGAFANKVQTEALKIGINHRPVQIAVSGYDQYASSTHERYTRWGAYGLFGLLKQKLTLTTEAVGGQNELPTGDKTRVAGLYAEAGYTFSRTITVNARYDFLDQNRDLDGQAAERYMGEGVWTIVPFADLRLSWRHIRPEMAGDEDQILSMFHFYY
jgi:hypothetical protein